MPYGLEIPRSIPFASSGTNLETVYAVSPGQSNIVKSITVNNSSDLYQLPETKSFAYITLNRRGIDYPVLWRTVLEPDETLFLDTPSVLEPGDLIRVATSGESGTAVNTYTFNMLELRA